MMPCLDCGTLVRHTRCKRCAAARQRLYRRREYLAVPLTGICHLCGLPIAPGEGTRDHLVPIALDPSSTAAAPAHRSCNSRRGVKRVLFSPST